MDKSNKLTQINVFDGGYVAPGTEMLEGHRPIGGPCLIEIVSPENIVEEIKRLTRKRAVNPEINAFSLGDSQSLNQGSGKDYPMVYAIQFYHIPKRH